jgi:hypothetical protein
MDKNNWYVILILTFLASFISAQDVRNYEMRCTVADAVNQEPMIGEMCFVDMYEHLPSVTGKNGVFRIEEIDLGRQTISITHLVYENYAALVEITGGKELVINIGMRVDIKTSAEVVITADSEKTSW